MLEDTVALAAVDDDSIYACENNMYPSSFCPTVSHWVWVTIPLKCHNFGYLTLEKQITQMYGLNL